MAAVGLGHTLGQNFRRVAVWFAVAGVFWLAGALVEGEARIACWVVAVWDVCTEGIRPWVEPG